MNKADLVNAISTKTGNTKKDTETILNATLDTISEVLSQGEKISLVGFGNFEVRDRAARKGRNPQSGEEVSIPASRVPAFKASKNLKEIVNN